MTRCGRCSSHSRRSSRCWSDRSTRSITIGEGVLPSYHALVPDQPPPEQLKIAPYLADWQDKFDYVLVLLAGGADDLPRLRPDRLELVDRTDFAALFRVRPGPRLMSH